MADELQWIEAALGAVSKIHGEVEGDDLVGARCPKCEATSFVKVTDLFADAVMRIEEQGGPPDAVHVGGMTDLQIIANFPPPRRKSTIGIMILFAIPLIAIDYYVYRRFGDVPSQACILASLVIMVILFMTSLRRYSDKHYHQRRRRNSLFMCRQCGQLVSSST